MIQQLYFYICFLVFLALATACFLVQSPYLLAICLLPCLYLLCRTFIRSSEGMFTRWKIGYQRLFFLLPLKLWMTFGIAFVFLSFLAVLVVLAQHTLSSELIWQCIHYGRQNPASFLYIGMAVFIANSAFILLVRSAIKFLFIRLKT